MKLGYTYFIHMSTASLTKIELFDLSVNVEKRMLQ